MAADDRLAGTPPYALRDGDGRRRLLAELTAQVTGWRQPGQVWHGPRPVRPPRQASPAADELATQLASRARARQTLLLAPNHRPADPPTAEHRHHLDLDGGCVGRALSLASWPARVRPGWLGSVTLDSAALVLHVRPVTTTAASRLLRRRLTNLSSSAALDQAAGRLPDPELTTAAGAAAALSGQLAAGGTRLFSVQVLVALVAPDLEQLDHLQQQLAERLGTAAATLDPLDYQQGPAWVALQPGGAPARRPWRLLDAAALAACLPHPVGPAVEQAGLLVGKEPVSGCPLLQDRFADHNPNRLVVGTSGAGKSFTSKLEVLRQLATGTRVVVVDPEGEFGPLAAALSGTGGWLQVGNEPGGLDPVGLACRPDLPPGAAVAVLTAWAAALIGEPLGPVDLAVLDWALAVLRADAATTPGPRDLLAVLTEICGHPPFLGASLPARLAPAVAGSLADLFAPNPRLANPPPLLVFDLRFVPDRARPAVMACVLAWTWAGPGTGPLAGRRLVVVDEAHLLLDDPAAAGLLGQLARRARKHGLAVEVVTQRLSDFLTQPAGAAVLANTASKLLLGCEDHERSAVAGGLGLTAREAELLRPGHRGRGLLLSPSWRGPIQVVAAPAEQELAEALGPDAAR